MGGMKKDFDVYPPKVRTNKMINELKEILFFKFLVKGKIYFHSKRYIAEAIKKI